MIPPTVLVILDGFGYNPETTGNAILNASTPNLDYLWNHYPHTLLKAAEEEVGLSFGEPGNSEVGHLTIGTGRVLLQSLPRINAAINDQSFFTNPAFLKAINHVQKYQSSLHLLGMISVAGVHAHLHHLLALIDLASRYHLPKVYLHLILDGRDSGPRDASLFLAKVNEAIKKYRTGTIASLAGRAYAMDRNHNWERTNLSYQAILGQGTISQSVNQVVANNYHQGSDDENLVPTTIVDQHQQPLGPLTTNDAVIFFNYREDRAIQLTQLLTQSQFKNLLVVTMTQYDQKLPVIVAFPPQNPPNSLSDCLHSHQIPQIHLAETEKYAHVTYFFNGGRTQPLPTEKFMLLPSPKPETFVTQPEMAGPQITTAVIEAINKGWPFIVVNYANPDMVAHTGNLSATTMAVSLTDAYIGQIFTALQAKNGLLFLTSDHGNAESLLNPATNQSDKDHSDSPVPFIAALPSLLQSHPQSEARVTLGSSVSGVLADVAPTILSLLKLPIPPEMTGTPLF